jgi:UDP-GlcNAc3NAcA epimerase
MTHREQRSIFLICGVRPQYIKASGLLKLIGEFSAQELSVRVVDAGQHYDQMLSQGIIADVGLVTSCRLAHRSLDANERAAAIFVQLAEQFRATPKPPVVVGFGDTTTTIMAALAALTTRSPFAHVEAGVRSTAGPEGASIENSIRRMVGQASSLNLCVLPSHRDNLAAENAPGRSVVVGDLGRLGIAPWHGRADDEILCVIHKTENTSAEGIAEILAALGAVGKPTAFVMHPSVERLLATGQLQIPPCVTLVSPSGHKDMLDRLFRCRLVLTDSGGIQREAFYARRRCIVRRDTKGWTELHGPGGHVQVGRSAASIASAIESVWTDPEWSGAQSIPFDVPGGAELAVSELARLASI